MDFFVWFIELGNEIENPFLISNQHLQLVLTGVNYAAFLIVFCKQKNVPRRTKLIKGNNSWINGLSLE